MKYPHIIANSNRRLVATDHIQSLEVDHLRPSGLRD